MGAFIGKRLLAIIPIAFFATLLAFILIHISSVDPAEAYLTVAHIHVTDEILAQKRHEFGLDQPLPVQYAHFLINICKLDFGTSYLSGKPVWNEVLERAPATLELTFSAIALAILVSVSIGLLSSFYKNGIIDHISRGITFLGASIPQFWLGYLLIFVFSVKLDFLPVQGTGTWLHLLLPSLTLAAGLIAIYSRLLRTTVLEQLQQAYVLYARTRGIKERVILGKHVLRIAFSPMLTGLGMNIGKLLGGTIVVEEVFSWPGFGRYFVEAIFNRDIPVIQCYVLLSAGLFIVCNLLVDVLQMLLDPRISRERRAIR